MIGRRRSFRKTSTPEHLGGLPLTYAKLIVKLEAYGSAFALPMLVLGLFVAFAWLGVFTSLYPWAHLVALALFTAWFFSALREARWRYRAPSKSMARRRLEIANRLSHRPLDVIDDRPIITEEGQKLLWRRHVDHSKAQLKNLRRPRWGLSFADRDPYALRYALAILLVIGVGSSWGGWGGKLLAAVNPAIGNAWRLTPVTINAWITPPEYTNLSPIMIATPAGVRFDKDVVDVPEGSVLSVHVADGSTAPVLDMNGVKQELQQDDRGDYSLTRPVTAGDKIAVQRGWRNLGSWKIRVVPDTAPQVAFKDEPVATERKATRLSYEATDDYGVQSITAKITPTITMPGISSAPVEVALASPQAKQAKRVGFEDLTASPWAGMPVKLQLVATDAVGHTATSETKTITLPERQFLHPLARALVEERKKLLSQPDEVNRDEAANIMASIARQPASYNNDPLVLMALRSGAVRLVLNEGVDTIPEVSDILWQTAVRLEDGTVGMAQDMLRDAQRDLAAALDRNASEAEIQQLIDRMQMALARYLNELSARMAQQPAAAGNDLQQLVGPQTNMLTPEDLRQMLEQMRDLSTSGSRESAREHLAQLQQLLENLRTSPPELTAAQRRQLQQLTALRDLAKAQQQALDQTFRTIHDDTKTPAKQELRKLTDQQNALLQKLRALLPKLGKEAEQLGAGETAMQGAVSALHEGALQGATKRQSEAVTALQKGLQSMMDAMKQHMMALPGNRHRPGGDHDPFGRSSGVASDDGATQVPDHLNAQRAREILDELQRRMGEGDRPKIERDYLERLLQRF